MDAREIGTTDEAPASVTGEETAQTVHNENPKNVRWGSRFDPLNQYRTRSRVIVVSHFYLYLSFFAVATGANREISDRTAAILATLLVVVGAVVLAAHVLFTSLRPRIDKEAIYAQLGVDISLKNTQLGLWMAGAGLVLTVMLSLLRSSDAAGVLSAGLVTVSLVASTLCIYAIQDVVIAVEFRRPSPRE